MGLQKGEWRQLLLHQRMLNDATTYHTAAISTFTNTICMLSLR